jgi:YidC/Oxa1 family membrane protein insertase
MLHDLWNAILYKPLVNILALLVSIIPGGDIGIAIIILTVLVKFALYPLSQRSIESQAKINLLAPELNKIKESGASKEEQARLTFELYKKNKTNPFSGCLLILIQLPIIFALYYVFLKGMNLDGGLLYSFIHAPENINMNFLGLIDIGQKSLLLAILAGVSQFFQDSFAKSMQVQMKYVFPFIVGVIAYSVSGAVALYWITNNIFTIFQQIRVEKKKDLFVTVK